MDKIGKDTMFYKAPPKEVAHICAISCKAVKLHCFYEDKLMRQEFFVPVGTLIAVNFLTA
jgi:hypothetical protein